MTDAELNGWISDSYRELYDLLASTFEGYNVTSAEVPVSSGNSIPLPADFYKLYAVDLVLSLPDQLTSLPRVQFSDRNSGRSGYDLRADAIIILPYSAAAGHTYRVHYLPTATPLTTDSSTFDGVNGYEEMIILDTCLKVVAKGGEDASLFGAQKAAMLDRVLTSAHSRDAGEPAHTTDVYGAGGTWFASRWMGE